MKKISFFLLSIFILTSCLRSDSWNIIGEVNCNGDTVYIQAPTRFGSWYNVDSTVVKHGSYAFSLPEASSTIYRLKVGDNVIYVPADSTETIYVSLDGKRSGSVEAELFNKVDSLKDDSRELLKALDGNYSSTAAYYATRLNKDFKLLRAVTNRYNEEKPEDLRTAVLMAEFQKKMPKSTEPPMQQVIYAEEIGYYDVELMNRNGEMQKLSDLVDSNPIVILAYVNFLTEETPAITRALGDAYSAGAKIYEVGFAENQHLWANASEGLPWVCVYQSDAANQMHLRQYAVTGLPTFYVIKNGEIIERTVDYTSLENIITNIK